jgi:mycothiol system anti-sigma-R factor
MSSITTEFTNLQPSSIERAPSPLAHGRKEVMLCDEVKRVMYFFLDGSLGDSKRQTVEIHLHDCPDCEVRITVHRKLRSFLRRRLSPKPAPDTLRIRLSQSLRTATAE